MNKSVRRSTKSDEFVINTMFITLMVILLLIEHIVAGSFLGDEYIYFFSWWCTLIAPGVIFMPLCGSIFRNFADRGFLFSAITGLAVTGWLMWFLSSLHILRFTFAGCLLCVALAAGLNLLLLLRMENRGPFRRHKRFWSFFELKIDRRTVGYILLSVSIFTGLFIMWLRVKGCNPGAFGTERPMDFGFMKAIYKSDYMPPEDLWLSGLPINYYYVGQYMATYLSKLSGTGVEYGYNLMLMTIAAMAVTLPAVIVFNMASDHVRYKNRTGMADRIFPFAAASVSGLAVGFTSNAHYIIFDIIVPKIRSFPAVAEWAEKHNISLDDFFFPDSTRYIGYNPDTADKTIHEFPLYSFILGDLHAHVINIIFVLTVVAVLYAYVQYRRDVMKRAVTEHVYGYVISKTTGRPVIPDLLKEIFHPCVVLIGFFIGLFHTTNFWDYPIYFVVSGAILLFTNAVVYGFSRLTVMITVFHAAVVVTVSTLVCMPFTLRFEQISTFVNLCVSHTPLYQLLILWGLPIALLICFLAIMIVDLKKRGVFAPDAPKDMPGRSLKLFRFIGNLEPSDMVALTLALCALGLVLIPEVIYVKDIYEGDYKRANTMFKLTYQAFILFGLSSGYFACRMIFNIRSKAAKVIGVIAVCFVLTMTGYFGTAARSWFGQDPGTGSDSLSDWIAAGNYRGISAGNFLSEGDFLGSGGSYDDYSATEWIEANIEGRPVLLQVQGDSYSTNCMVSARTGLPTVLGWTTHEWLWQSNSDGGYPEIMTERTGHIRDIYTTEDPSYLRTLIELYDIEYIYVGDAEKKEFGNDICHSVLQGIGDVVYPLEFIPELSDSTTYIIKVRR